MSIVFAHGLEGNPNGTKVVALRDAGFHVVAPDFRQQGLAERVANMRQTLQEQTAHSDPFVLAGSSYGGLCVAALAHEFSSSLRGLLLLAPALGHQEPGPDGALIVGSELVPPPTLDVIVIHGEEDPVCAIEHSRAYVAQSKRAELIAVDDGHRLTGSLARICAAAAQLLGESSQKK